MPTKAQRDPKVSGKWLPFPVIPHPSRGKDISVISYSRINTAAEGLSHALWDVNNPFQGTLPLEVVLEGGRLTYSSFTSIQGF